MFRHVLLPTDGSRIANKAVRLGLAFARQLGARVTALHVTPAFRMLPERGLVPADPMLRKRIEEDARALAHRLLTGVAKQAEGQGVRCETLAVVDDLPYRQIIALARKRKCDVIMMGSHGQHGLSGLLLGSETSKVLAHAKIPVLVVR